MKLTSCRNHQVENMLRQTSRVESLFSLRQRFNPGPLSKDNRSIVLTLLLMLLHAKDIWRIFQVGKLVNCTLNVKD